MNTPNTDTNEAQQPASDGCMARLVRPCLVTKSDGSYYSDTYRTWEEKARFHTWTKYSRCAVGDGSMVDWVTLAVIEWPDGKIDLCEPCQIQFTDRKTREESHLCRFSRAMDGTCFVCGSVDSDMANFVIRSAGGWVISAGFGEENFSRISGTSVQSMDCGDGNRCLISMMTKLEMAAREGGSVSCSFLKASVTITEA